MVVTNGIEAPAVLSGGTDPASPYAGIDKRAFWRHGVANQHMAEIEDIYRPKFEITRDMPIATAGSCFAQHIARNFRARGYTVLDGEPRPPGMPAECALEYGFDMYSCRYGNIYTARELLQMWREVKGEIEPALPIWERDGRYYDAFRPNIEPNGLASAEMVAESRRRHLRRVYKTYTRADLFVFTFGLTETWEHIPTGTIYPTAPGTIAGSFDPEIFRFKNLTFNETFDDFVEFRRMLRLDNPNVRFLITVSPVPLTATASDDHVMPATTYSKSLLRTVTGQLAATFDDIDYFPSYEIVTAPSSRGFFYETNMREVAASGVEMVMNLFFAAQPTQIEELAPRKARNASKASKQASGNDGAKQRSADDVMCEDALLEAFA